MILKELKTLNSKNVLSYISQEDIYKFYMPSNFKFNVPFSSPFRKDSHPSFIIGSSGMFKDFAMGETGNCFNFVMNLFQVNYNLALIQIVSDFNISSEFEIHNNNYIISDKKAEYNNASNKLYTGSTLIQIKKREWEDYDVDYWKGYGIELTFLRLGWIFPISHYFLNGTPYKAEKHAYAYVEKKDGKITYKIYQPFSRYKKFFSGNNSSVWELWHLLPEKGDYLIITSSRKDALCIINNFKIPSVSLQSESTLPKKKVMEDVLSRFKKVYLLYDNDFLNEENNGQIMAKKLLDKYPELINIVIPEEHKSKDISDLIKKEKQKGIEIFKQIINEK